MIEVYGITYLYQGDWTHIDVSKTERGAKLYATRHGYTKVSIRQGYHSKIIAEKVNGKWQSVEMKAWKE